jgi:uncharacterized membrane protein YhfC
MKAKAVSNAPLSLDRSVTALWMVIPLHYLIVGLFMAGEQRSC